MICNTIKKASDNYVKSEGTKDENGRVKNNGPYMLIKLAIGGGETELNKISSCCKDNGCKYIHIRENKFGILTDVEYEVASGQEASNDNVGYNIRKFIDIYNCSKSPSGFIFKKQQNAPYASILLDNQYYINLLEYCKNNRIEINYMEFKNLQGSRYRKENADEIEREFRSENRQKAVELCFTYENSDIIIKKSGYVLLASGSGTDFYDRNRQKIDEIISVGFKDSHD